MDWLGNAFCRLRAGVVTAFCTWTMPVIYEQVTYENLVQRSFDKVPGRAACPPCRAQLSKQSKRSSTDPDQARVLMDEAAMIQHANLDQIGMKSSTAPPWSAASTL